MPTQRIIPDEDFGKIILRTRRGARNVTMRVKPDGLYLTGTSIDGRQVSITVKKGVLEVEGISQEELDAILEKLPSVLHGEIDHYTPDGVPVNKQVDIEEFYDPDAEEGHEYDLLTAKVESELRAEGMLHGDPTLYDRMKHMPTLMNRFIDATGGFGLSQRMSEDEKRDYMSDYTEDDVREAYDMDFI